MGNIIVLSAPSGAGKTTIALKLLEEMKNVKRVVTTTTRPKRPNEKEGIDYNFVSKEEFEHMIKNNEFVEYANVYGNYYGTPIRGIKAILEEGFDALLVIDIQGAKSIKNIFPYALLIFLMPPSLEELYVRFKNRDFEDKNALERVESAKKEIACARYFDFIVVNRYVDETVDMIKSIISCNKARREYFLEHKNYVEDDIINILEGGKCDVFET
ncbi:guanylate kinase [Hydrogenobaculum acidophilum]